MRVDLLLFTWQFEAVTNGLGEIVGSSNKASNGSETWQAHFWMPCELWGGNSFCKVYFGTIWKEAHNMSKQKSASQRFLAFTGEIFPDVHWRKDFFVQWKCSYWKLYSSWSWRECLSWCVLALQARVFLATRSPCFVLELRCVAFSSERYCHWVETEQQCNGYGTNAVSTIPWTQRNVLIRLFLSSSLRSFFLSFFLCFFLPFFLCVCFIAYCSNWKTRKSRRDDETDSNTRIAAFKQTDRQRSWSCVEVDCCPQRATKISCPRAMLLFEANHSDSSKPIQWNYPDERQGFLLVPEVAIPRNAEFWVYSGEVTGQLVTLISKLFLVCFRTLTFCEKIVLLFPFCSFSGWLSRLWAQNIKPEWILFKATHQHLPWILISEHGCSDKHNDCTSPKVEQTRTKPNGELDWHKWQVQNHPSESAHYGDSD